jgi:hypothetical protein
MNGLARRVEALEARAVTGADPYLGDALPASVRRLSDLAERLRGTTEPSLEQQSPAERTVRAGLAAIAGVDDPRERARRFWSTVAEQLRAWDRRRVA